MLTSSFPRFVTKIHFHGIGIDKTVTGKVGETLLHVAEKNQVKIPMACEGSGACGTCQLYINQGAECLSPMDERENDTLDYAVEVRDNSRLACRSTIVKDDAFIDCEIPMHARNII